MAFRKAKQRIPAALREATWIKYNGNAFQAECHVTWCENVLTPFSFEVGHNVPESKGGALELDNLRPICPRCNRSMGATYTIDEFSALTKRTEVKIKKSRSLFGRIFCIA